MIVELASILGAAGGGKLLGMFASMLHERSVRKREESKQKHIEDLASRDQLKGHVTEINGPQEDGTYSPLAYCAAYSIGMFATVYSIATVSCFIWEPTAIIYTKDPSDVGNSFSIFWGFIEFDISNSKVIRMSKIGLGVLLLHPIIFIFSMLFTGDSIRKR